MNRLVSFLYDFVLLFLLFYIIYSVFINKKKKSYSKLKKNDEVKIFIARYNLDVRKLDYKKILNAVSIINSFIISFTSTLILNIDNFMISIMVCFVVLMILIYSLYEIAGRYFKKMEEKENV